MLGLAEQIGGDPIRIVAAIGDHQNFRRPGDGIDAHLAEHFALGRCDIGIARAHDLVHRLDAFGAERQRRHGLRPADAENIAHTRAPRRRQHQRIDRSAAGRRHHHDALHARDPAPGSRSSAPMTDRRRCRRAHKAPHCPRLVQRQPSPRRCRR